MKLIKTLILLFSLITLIGCSQKPTRFPNETDFSIEAEVSNLSPKAGEEIIVKTKFINNSNFNYEIARGPKLVLVQLRKADDPIDFVVTLPENEDEIKANKTYEESEVVVAEEPSKYKITIAASFTITIGNESERYTIKSEQVNISTR